MVLFQLVVLIKIFNLYSKPHANRIILIEFRCYEMIIFVIKNTYRDIETMLEEY